MNVRRTRKIQTLVCQIIRRACTVYAVLKWHIQFIYRYEHFSQLNQVEKNSALLIEFH